MKVVQYPSGITPASNGATSGSMPGLGRRKFADDFSEALNRAKAPNSCDQYHLPSF